MIVVDKQVRWLIVCFVDLKLFFVFLDFYLPRVIHYVGCKFAFGAYQFLQTKLIVGLVFKLD